VYEQKSWKDEQTPFLKGKVIAGEIHSAIFIRPGRAALKSFRATVNVSERRNTSGW
jgi:hypothetical protein